MEDRKKFLIISSIVLAVLIVIAVITSIVKFVNRTIDVSDAKHSVTIVENTDFYKKAKLEKNYQLEQTYMF
jgi:sensor domain CHASE-containing protein